MTPSSMQALTTYRPSGHIGARAVLVAIFVGLPAAATLGWGLAWAQSLAHGAIASSICAVLAALGCLLLAGSHFELGGWFHLGLLAAAGCFVWEFWYTRDRDPQRCFKAFLHNHWAGLAIFVGIVLNYAVA